MSVEKFGYIFKNVQKNNNPREWTEKKKKNEMEIVISVIKNNKERKTSWKENNTGKKKTNR